MKRAKVGASPRKVAMALFVSTCASRWVAALVVSLFLLIGAAPADNKLEVQEGDVELHDFVFQSGERLPVLNLHYAAIGSPRRDAAGKVNNAVLLLHGTAGVGKSLLAPTLAENLFRPGQPLDAERYYIVLPDGIGAGGSTKPSDGLHARFPHYGYIDQVEAQHAMLERIGIDRVKLVSGISQGGMQTWLWAERFPDAMDALVPIGCMPMQISGLNLMWRQVIIRAIRNDPGWHEGEYDPAHPPTVWMQTAAPLIMVMASNPEKLQAAGPDRARTLAFYDQLVTQYNGRDPNDYLYDFESSRDYDPATDVDRIKAPMLAINFADDQFNPTQFAVTQQTVARLPSGRLVVMPGGDAGYGHIAIFHAEIWTKELGTFLDEIPGWKEAGK
jgi:homoserine O-acetyltransferase